MFNRLQGIKDSGGRVAHIHISETVSNAHLCRFCFWYASQQIKPLIAFDVELILWTASGLQSGKERILRLMLHFTHWVLSCTELSAPGACAGPRLGWSQREERRSLLTVREIWGERLQGLQRSNCQRLDSIYNKLGEVRVVKKRGLGDGWRGTKLSCVWSENVALCVCCGTCGLHRRVADGTQEHAWQSMDKARC